MRKITACLFIAGALAGPFASMAAAADPGSTVRGVVCKAEKAVGVDNVQQCDF